MTNSSYLLIEIIVIFLPCRFLVFRDKRDGPAVKKSTSSKYFSRNLLKS